MPTQVPFTDFSEAVFNAFNKMAEYPLFTVDVSKDDLWNHYLDSFPEGTNPIYRERTDHDCSCCRQFIKTMGNVVALIDGERVSIWDVVVGYPYDHVTHVLRSLVALAPISNVFLHDTNKVGTESNYETLDDGTVKTWNHFHCKLPSQVVIKDGSIATKKGKLKSYKDVLKRSILEISDSAIDVVIELIEQNSLYRGEEHLSTINRLKEFKNEYLTDADKDAYLWQTAITYKIGAAIRNTVIGTLLTDISDGTDLEAAVKAFELKVAPTNYKRPKSLITKTMIDKAQKKVEELGMESALQRRYAVMDDITINNVLYADRSVKESKGVFDDLKASVAENPANLAKVETVSIDTFLSNILPKANSLELLLENHHKGNLVSLVAPANAEAPNLLKWNNNFSWTYNGNVTDSMKEHVKAAGGDVTGDLRFSIQWNDNDDNQDDLDAHCKEPNSNLIYYSQKRSHRTGGRLDVDIIDPKGVAVENITWPNKNNMITGTYKLLVHCFSSRNALSGFSAEVEFDNQIYSFSYNKPLKQGEKIHVADVHWDGVNFTIDTKLPSNKSIQQVWNINTQKYYPVSMVMLSPNHWDGQTNGNKHWFFMLKNCVNPDQTRGFFNEYLNPELNEHRKVFEVLGSKMKTEPSEEQLSGLGFSSTQSNHVYCKVSGSFNRTIKIEF